MTVSVRIPRSLERLFPDAERTTAVEAGSVREVIDRLEERWPGVSDRVLGEDGRLRPHLKVFVDGVEADLDADLADGADVLLLAAVSGG